MSAIAIVLIVVGVLILLVLAGGFAAARQRDREGGDAYARHLAEADHALEQARAADKGWDRPVMEAAVQKALEQRRPGFTLDELHLVLVDDKPGVTEDRAHFVARSGGDEVRVVLSRGEAGWAAESVE